MIDINELIKIAESNDAENTIINYELKSFPVDKTLKRFILELKVQIDRWDLLSNLIIFNSALEEFVIESLAADLYKNKNQEYCLWGAEVLFISDCPPNRVLMLDALNTTPEYRHVALGKIDGELIKRYQELKSFW